MSWPVLPLVISLSQIATSSQSQRFTELPFVLLIWLPKSDTRSVCSMYNAFWFAPQTVLL